MLSAELAARAYPDDTYFMYVEDLLDQVCQEPPLLSQREQTRTLRNWKRVKAI